MPKARPDTGDAIAAARFSLTIDGVEIAQFSELVGITSEVEPDDLAGLLLKRLPGKRKPPTITLRRAMTSDTRLASWHESGRDAKATEVRKAASLVMYNPAGEPVARYHLENAWVPKIEIGALKAGTSEVLYETVTISGDTIQRDTV
jgi:phage tail-like protein